MAYIQRTTPPPNKIMNFTLSNFAGGLNDRSDQLEDNEALNLLNMGFVDDTLMEKRRGQKYYDELAIDKETEIIEVEGEEEEILVADNKIIFIDEYKPHSDDNVLLRATEKYLYVEDEVLTDLQGKPQGVNHNGCYFFTDGKKLFVYGIFHQTNTTYRKIKGTAINDYVLLEVVSPANGHDQLGTEHVEGVLTVDYDKYEIYYEPCKNEFEDNFKGANKVPENVQYIISHNGRVYLAGAEKDDDNVFISDINNPFYFPVSLPIQLPPNSDEIVGLAVYDNSVVDVS